MFTVQNDNTMCEELHESLIFMPLPDGGVSDVGAMLTIGQLIHAGLGVLEFGSAEFLTSP